MSEGVSGFDPDTYATAIEAMDMLHLLEYERKCCNDEYHPVNVYFFLTPSSNQASKFDYYSHLVEWLISLIGRDSPFAHNDSRSVMSERITEVLQDLRINVDYPSQDLLPGFGRAVISSIHALTSMALQHNQFRFSEPVMPTDIPLDETIEDETVEHEHHQVFFRSTAEMHTIRKTSDKITATNPAEWALEVERVAPRLRSGEGGGIGDWRAHFEQAEKLGKIFSSEIPNLVPQLKSMVSEIRRVNDLAYAKEKTISEMFDSKIAPVKGMKAERAELENVHDAAAAEVAQLREELNNLTGQYEEAKKELDEKSESATDTQPMVKLRQVIKDMHQEVKEMDIRIAAALHALMQHKIKQIGG